MSEDDLYELAEPDDEPTPPPPPAAPRQPVNEPTPDSPAAREKRPEAAPAQADATPPISGNEPLAVSPAKARRAREDQRRNAAMQQAEADARKQKRILITAGVLGVLLVSLWLWSKLS